MKNLQINDFINEIKSSQGKNLLIVPSSYLRQLFLKELDYNQIKTKTITLSDLFYDYVKMNLLKLPDDPIRKYFFSLAITNSEYQVVNENLYWLIENKALNNIQMDKYEELLFDKYKYFLNNNGYTHKSELIDNILKSNYIQNLNKYDAVFLIAPSYLSAKERDVLKKISERNNVIQLKYFGENLSKYTLRHLVAEDIDFLLYRIAIEIREKFLKNKDVRIAIINESFEVQEYIARELYQYNIFTNQPLIEYFYNINIVREKIDGFSMNLENFEEFLDDLKLSLNENIIQNYKVDTFFNSIRREILEGRISYPHYYIVERFKSHRYIREFSSNIHILKPSEVLLEYDYIFQIGLSEKDFTSSDQFSSEEINGVLSNLINKSKEMILCTYDTNSITKTDFLLFNVVEDNIPNFEWLKGGTQVSKIQKNYFNESEVLLDRKNNIVNQKNNISSISLRDSLTSSKIMTYQSCPFKYYCEYVKKIEVDSKSMYADIGNICHEILRMYYRFNEKKTYNKESFKTAIEIALSEYDCFYDFQIAIIKNKLRTLLINEEEYEGEVVSTEQAFSHQYFSDMDGNTITFKGKIDRIDRNDNGLILIDYKLSSSSIPSKNKLTNGEALQLPIYTAGYFNDIVGMCYIDISDGKRKSEISFHGDGAIDKKKFMEMCSEKIKIIIQEMDKGVIKRTEDTSNCRYCSYDNFCKRFWND